ncbi:MAG TPA: hypothetical protein VMW63_00315 [Methanoregulaceae archaeon]|nr:hypothetical protein [Methanoregulaceae archaeon]
MIACSKVFAGKVVSAGNRLIVPVIRKTLFWEAGACVVSAIPLALVIVEGEKAFVAPLGEDIDPDTLMSILSEIFAKQPDTCQK